jgi:hypothetical protein
MAIATKLRMVRCGGCGRRMVQNTRANRDQQGRSWHYDCLGNACGSMRRFYAERWAADKKRNGWKKSEEKLTMTITQPSDEVSLVTTCEERIDAQMGRTLSNLRGLTELMDTGNETEREAASDELWYEPLSITTRITKIVQLSWGGPADQLEYDFDEDRTITEIRYRFMNWGDGAVRTLEGASYELALRLYSEWVPE